MTSNLKFFLSFDIHKNIYQKLQLNYILSITVIYCAKKSLFGGKEWVRWWHGHPFYICILWQRCMLFIFQFNSNSTGCLILLLIQAIALLSQLRRKKRTGQASPRLNLNFVVNNTYKYLKIFEKKGWGKGMAMYVSFI